jgi:2-dehydropantoate 2-reductase
MGGQCQIAATLDESGNVIHLNETQQLSFGELSGARSQRATTAEAIFARAKFDSRLSEAILQEMWEKWVFLAALAASTCLMRSSVGQIVRSGSGALQQRLLRECAAIAEAQGYAPRPQPLGRAEAVLTDPASTLTASMLRDMERGARTESEHVIGDLLNRRRDASTAISLLEVAYAHLKAYELRRSDSA